MSEFEKNTIHEAMKALESSSFLSAAKALEDSSLFATMKSFENSSAVKAMKALENSSFLRAAKALENSSLFATMKSFENSSAVKAMKALENSSFLSAAKVFENSSLGSTIRALQDSSRFASFNELAERFSSQNVGPLTLSEAYQFVTESYLQTSGTSEIDRLEELTGNVAHSVQKAPGGALSKEFYLGLVLSLFLFWLSQISSTQSEEKMLLRIQQLETTISQQLTELKTDEGIETFYVVDRAVKLRVKPNTDSGVINILYPNAKVKLITRSSQWIRIEYFDYTENVYVSGWAFKKYLTILNPKKKKQ
jgi:hypothetical protein